MFIIYRQFGSQTIEIFESGKFVRTHIREAFYTAGKRLGWAGNTAGIGLNPQIIAYAKEHGFRIRVIIGNSPKEYESDPKDWKDEYEVRGRKLLVMQWSKMRSLDG